jgi:hypothetical protein
MLDDCKIFNAKNITLKIYIEINMWEQKRNGFSHVSVFQTSNLPAWQSPPCITRIAFSALTEEEKVFVINKK